MLRRRFVNSHWCESFSATALTGIAAYWNELVPISDSGWGEPLAVIASKKPTVRQLLLTFVFAVYLHYHSCVCMYHYSVATASGYRLVDSRTFNMNITTNDSVVSRSPCNTRSAWKSDRGKRLNRSSHDSWPVSSTRSVVAWGRKRIHSCCGVPNDDYGCLRYGQVGRHRLALSRRLELYV
jgi:hypothetical protein